MIEMRNVSKFITEPRRVKINGTIKIKKQQLPILSRVNLLIPSGEFVYITGASGAGKSTFLKLLYKDMVPEQGEIYVNQYRLSQMKRKELPYLRRDIGVVFQDFRLLPQMTVEENLVYALDIVKTPPEQIQRKVNQALRLVGLTHKRHATKLSGGEAQRAAIARAIINQPRILLADEPTGNLDAKNAMQVLDLLERIHRKGVTVVMTTHNQSLVRRFPHRVIHLANGKVVHDSRPAKRLVRKKTRAKAYSR